MGGGGTRDGSLGHSPADVRQRIISPDAVGARGGRGVGLHLQLRGPGLGLLEPPLPSAAQFDDAWDHRVCATK